MKRRKLRSRFSYDDLLKFDVDDRLQIDLGQAAEDDDVVHAVEELRPEALLHHALELLLHGVIRRRFTAPR